MQSKFAARLSARLQRHSPGGLHGQGRCRAHREKGRQLPSHHHSNVRQTHFPTGKGPGLRGTHPLRKEAREAAGRTARGREQDGNRREQQRLQAVCIGNESGGLPSPQFSFHKPPLKRQQRSFHKVYAHRDEDWRRGKCQATGTVEENLRSGHAAVGGRLVTTSLVHNTFPLKCLKVTNVTHNHCKKERKYGRTRSEK